MFLEDLMHHFTKQEINNMTLNDIQNAIQEVQKEVNKLDNKLWSEINNSDLQDFKKIFAITQQIRFREKMEIGFHELLFHNKIEELKEVHNKLANIIIKELKKNKEVSEETKIKLKELEKESKKKSKSFSLIGNLNLSGISSNFTGLDVGE